MIWKSPNDASGPGQPERVDMYQPDSSQASARARFTSSPHLHAAHWMISSVVPLKSPVTCLRSATNLGHAEYAGFHAIADGSDGTVLFAVVFEGRFSAVGVT